MKTTTTRVVARCFPAVGRARARRGEGGARGARLEFARTMSPRRTRATGDASTRRAASSSRASSSSSSSSIDTDDDADDETDDEAYAAGRLAAVVNSYDEAALSATPTAMSQYVREGLEALSEEGRVMFLDRLSSSGIENAWTIAGEGYALTRGERSTASGVDFHAANEILGGDDEDDGDEVDGSRVRVFEGKVGKLRGSFLNRFSKAFYVDEDDDPLRGAPATRFLGRASIKKGPLDALLPLYFASNDLEDDAVYVPGTNERADVSLDYRNVPVLPSKRPDSDAAYSWPAPRLALWPFDRLVDYIRPLGPGVLVGRGYRHADGDETATTATRFLDFVLVRAPSSRAQ